MPWDFLSDMLEKGGVVATLFFVLIIAFGLTVRVLWNKNQELHKQLKSQADSAKKMAMAHAVQLREMSDQHVGHLKGLTTQHAADRKSQSDEYARQLLLQANRINELQDRRVEETRVWTEKVITYIGNIDKFANKLEATIDVLIRASERGAP